MTFIERLELLDRFIGFIQREGTGTPRQMARRLRISERTVTHNLLCDLKQMGFEIGYCRDRLTYYFKEDMEVNFFPVRARNVKGGQNLVFFDRVHDWCSERRYFYTFN